MSADRCSVSSVSFFRRCCSAAAGVFTGILIFLFKAAVSWVVAHSETVYEAVHTNPVRIPVLIAGMALVGWLAAVILNYAPEARGGGIPTAITILRGIVPFHWIKSILSVFGSAMLTYFCGVPLGNEGPSVQMGTAVGRGSPCLQKTSGMGLLYHDWRCLYRILPPRPVLRLWECSWRLKECTGVFHRCLS